MSVLDAVAWLFLAWYAVVLVVAALGFYCICTVFEKPPASDARPDCEPVTIIRPIKGIDPELTSCLELSFLQDYPADKVQILFCLQDHDDPALPVLEMLVAKYPDVDAQILILAPGSDHFGPNPKVNNLAKGFLRAKHDLLWIVDLNVWALRHVLANLVFAMASNSNCGRRVPALGRRVALVHHVPLALSLDHHWSGKGSLLDEMFLFTSHLKFYVSLNNLNIAPCVNGKSNMYRRRDLDFAVSRIPVQHSAFFHELSVVEDARRIAGQGPGHSLEFFAKYIGEDNMIAIALWEYCNGRTALTGDVVVQPLMAQKHADSVQEYSSRRVRWLRVRKYMVLAATLVEPTTESLICGLMGTFAVSRLVLGRNFSAAFFAFHMACWLVCDYRQFYLWVRNIDSYKNGPAWLNGIAPLSRDVWLWMQVWAMREAFALPIWVTAMAGHTINWRGRPFKIKKDLSAEEL